MLLASALAMLVLLGALPRALPPAERSAPDLGRAALAFVPNAGQFDPGVRFQAGALGGTLFFKPDAVVLALPDAGNDVQLRFDAANPRAQLRALTLLGS